MDLLVVLVNIMMSWVYGFMDLSNYITTRKKYIYIYTNNLLIIIQMRRTDAWLRRTDARYFVKVYYD